MEVCPYCESVWSLEEIEDKSCGSCGYPNVDRSFDEEEYFEEEIIGYHCLGCGNIQSNTGLGYRCNRCYGGCLDEMYG